MCNNLKVIRNNINYGKQKHFPLFDEREMFFLQVRLKNEFRRSRFFLGSHLFLLIQLY